MGRFALPKERIAPSEGRIVVLWRIRPFVTVHNCVLLSQNLFLLRPLLLGRWGESIYVFGFFPLALETKILCERVPKYMLCIFDIFSRNSCTCQCSSPSPSWWPCIGIIHLKQWGDSPQCSDGGANCPSDRGGSPQYWADLPKRLWFFHSPSIFTPAFCIFSRVLIFTWIIIVHFYLGCLFCTNSDCLVSK